MASYDGINGFFGYSVKMTTVENPRRCQMNTYPGLDGVEELDQGFNGRLTIVTGKLAANTPFLLGLILRSFESYNDGIARVLTDTEGQAWPSVKLESFEPAQGSAKLSIPLGYTRDYAARFRHQI